jgi:hypothetical protein
VIAKIQELNFCADSLSCIASFLTAYFLYPFGVDPRMIQPAIRGLSSLAKAPTQDFDGTVAVGVMS